MPNPQYETQRQFVEDADGERREIKVKIIARKGQAAGKAESGERRAKSQSAGPPLSVPPPSAP